MFEGETKLQNRTKKRKALLYAGLVTFVIALLYVILMRDNLYKFKGNTVDVGSVLSSVKDVSKNIGEDIHKGKEVINKK